MEVIRFLMICNPNGVNIATPNRNWIGYGYDILFHKIILLFDNTVNFPMAEFMGYIILLFSSSNAKYVTAITVPYVLARKSLWLKEKESRDKFEL